MEQSTHERISREDAIAPGSNRKFGMTMGVVFALIALLNRWHDGHLWLYLGGIAVLFLAAAVLVPAALNPVNVLWFKFGLLLHKIVNPIVMGAVFYLVVTPFGMVMRLGRGELTAKRRPDKAATTYWISRAGGSSPMDQQF